MRFSTPLFLALILPALHLVSATPHRNRQNKGDKFRSKKSPAVSTPAPLPSTTTSPAAAGNVLADGDNNGNNNNGGNGNPDPSLCLNSAVIGDNLAKDGQEDGPNEGQVKSLTSKNNYIDFCLGKVITDGLQVVSGSCNPVPMGDIPSTDKMPSAKFLFPQDGDTIEPNKAFTVRVAVNHILTGNFVNPKTNYYSAPQQLSGGIIVGHSHLTIQEGSPKGTTPLDTSTFVFFKGLNDPADGNGVLQTDVTGGLPEGEYRQCTVNAAANHQAVNSPVAQRGSHDDCCYFTVKSGGGDAPAPDNGGGNNNGGNVAANNGTVNNGGGNDQPANGAANNGTVSNGGGNDQPANGAANNGTVSNGGGNNGGNNQPADGAANNGTVSNGGGNNGGNKGGNNQPANGAANNGGKNGGSKGGNNKPANGGNKPANPINAAKNSTPSSTSPSPSNSGGGKKGGRRDGGYGEERRGDRRDGY